MSHVRQYKNNLILNRADKNNLILNRAKTKEIIFCSSRSVQLPPPLDGRERVSSFRKLGVIVQNKPELSTGRMDPRVGSGRVGSGRVGSRFCQILAGRVGSGQPFGFLSFLLIFSWYLNRCESSNTTLGLIDI